MIFLFIHFNINFANINKIYEFTIILANIIKNNNDDVKDIAMKVQVFDILN